MASTKKKGVKKAPAKKEVKRKAVAKKGSKKAPAVKKVEYVLTQTDLDSNPSEFKKKKAGDKVKVPESRIVDYTITEKDLETNAEYLAVGYEVGEVIKVLKAAGDFHIKVSMNDAIFEIDSDLIGEPMLSLKPDVLKTKVIINITHTPSKKSAEFVLFNMRAKRLFTLPLAAMAFEKNVKTVLNVKS